MQCPQITNPLGERELSLRGVGLQSLDSRATSSATTAASTMGFIMGASSPTTSRAPVTLLNTICQQFDTLDLCDNRIRHLDSFSELTQQHQQNGANPSSSSAPVINSSGNLLGYDKDKDVEQRRNNHKNKRQKGGAGGSDNGAVTLFAPRSLAPPIRLTTLILHNNQLRTLSAAAARGLAPTLHTFVAHHNFFTEFADVANFAKLTNLERLSLKENPIGAKQGQKYRLYLISRCPKLKLLDFNRVLETEKELATAFGKEMAAAEVDGSAAANGASPTDGVPSSRRTRREARKRQRDEAATGKSNAAEKLPDGVAMPVDMDMNEVTSETAGASLSTAPAAVAKDDGDDDSAIKGMEEEKAPMTLAERREAVEMRLAEATTLEEMTLIEAELQELEALEQAEQ